VRLTVQVCFSRVSPLASDSHRVYLLCMGWVCSRVLVHDHINVFSRPWLREVLPSGRLLRECHIKTMEMLYPCMIIRGFPTCWRQHHSFLGCMSKT
jgi:hypothetical protein